MTQQAATILKRARERMTARREEHADELMSWKAATGAIGDAAALGLGEVEIAAPAGVDLRASPTAKATAAKLVAGGFTTDWIERPSAKPGGAKTWALLIRW